MILTQKNLEDIREVNASWNSKIRFMRDIDLHKMKEYWTFPKKEFGVYWGDCEDYACAKKKTLIEEHNIPCWFATCWCFPNRKRYHAVAIVHSQIGIIILDNRHKILRLARDSEYEFHIMETENKKWVHFKDKSPANPPKGYVEMFKRAR